LAGQRRPSIRTDSRETFVDMIPVLRISTVANSNDGFQIRPNHRTQVAPNNTKVMADQISSMLMAVQSGRAEKIASAVGRTISVSILTAVSNRSRLIASVSITLPQMARVSSAHHSSTQHSWIFPQGASRQHRLVAAQLKKISKAHLWWSICPYPIDSTLAHYHSRSSRD
jgi:hypothetical protein